MRSPVRPRPARGDATKSRGTFLVHGREASRASRTVGPHSSDVVARRRSASRGRPAEQLSVSWLARSRDNLAVDDRIVDKPRRWRRGEYEIVEVRTSRGVSRVMLFSKAIIRAEWEANAPLREAMAIKRERWRVKRAAIERAAKQRPSK